jgi:phage tail sheath gpL-like
MPIDFDSIPTNERVPFVMIEFDNTGAISTEPTQVYTSLMFGQRLPGAAIAANVPTLVTSLQQVAEYFGISSHLYQMAEQWFANNTTTELYIVAQDDNPAGVAATASIAFTGPATAAGTLSLYIGGNQYQVGVTAGMTASALATAVAAAINADATIPVTATASTSTVNLACDFKGLGGNDIDVRLNYYSGDATPAGIVATITAMSGGATNPSLAAAITAIGDTQYNIIVNPYTDSANMAVLNTELQRRWGPLVQREGVSISAYSGTVAALETYGNALNSQLESVMGTYRMPTPTYEFAAAIAAVVATYGSIDQARPFQTLPVNGVLPPALADRFVMSDRNVLLHDGISTYTVDASGVVRLERIITTYQTNAAGAPDASYLDLNTILTLSELRYEARNYILTKYARYKLADDGIRYSPDQCVVTPKLMKAELIALAQDWADAGLIEDIDGFKSGLIVERNATDRNRLDILMTPNLMNQLVDVAAQIQFVL